MIEFDDPIESAFGELEHGPAVRQSPKAGQVLGVLTRSDLLDFLAHRQRTPWYVLFDSASTSACGRDSTSC